ncbi:TRAP transporter solute receptor, DctP family [Variovorax sp. PBS-H4]|uniref:TRAP transporter substrate-binding protein DctP n=1 Tax=Variovorax sp. PBS-H4 TaxID=434008 RepID=UPI001317C806|nr:TRAP transporter substrate-binding protein DctP [Variovorax sp. PBS-H4]VTU29894.1 TRAP transporter solute receptor, DctP family [Variovorax sp. PBS-H4]
MRRFNSLLLALGLALGGAASAQTRIVLGGSMPAKGPDSRALVSFAQKVEQQSKGTLKFDASFDGQVVNFRSSLGGVKDGLVDAIQLYPAFYLSELKVMNTFVDLGLAASESWAHTAAVAETVLLDCPSCDAEFARYKVKPLALSGSAPFNLICRNPVNTMADLKAKSIRAVSANQLLVKAVGANPVAIVPSEVFEAMQRGQVECVFSPLDWIPAYGLADAARFVVDTPLTHDSSRIPLAVSLDVWKKLTPDQKQAIVRNLPYLSAEATSNNIADGVAARQLAESKGLKFGSGGTDYVQQVASFRKGELDRVVRDAGARGVEGAAGMVNSYREKLAKWQKIVADGHGDRAKYEEALWREIYSKFK